MPFGIYDIAADAGWVSVGMNRDTSALAVQTVRRWWQQICRVRYPDARWLTITCDGGGTGRRRSIEWAIRAMACGSARRLPAKRSSR